MKLIQIRAIKNTTKKIPLENHTFNEIVNETKENFIIIDLDGKFKFISAPLIELLGLSEIPKDLDAVKNIMHRDDFKLVFNSFQKAIRERNYFPFEGISFRLLGHDGLYKWFTTSTNYFHHENGGIAGFISILKDITELKLAEDRLRVSEERYRLIVESVENDLITVINDEAEVEYLNIKAFTKVLGRTDFSHIQDFFNLTHPDDIKTFSKLLKLYWDIGEGTGIVRIQHKNGHYVWLEADLKTYKDAEERKKAILIARDITDRENIQQRLIKSQYRYRYIYENTTDLICVINERFKYDFINNGPHFQILGYYPHELIEHNIVKLIHPEDLPQVLETFKEMFKGKEVTAICRFKRKDKTYIWIKVIGKVFINPDGKINMIFVSREITERKRVEATRNRLLKYIRNQNMELKQLDRMKDEFFAEVAHDFRNPLTAIKGITDILLESENCSPKEFQGLEIIARNVLNLEYLINELINYTRLKENVLEFQKNNFKISSIITSLKQDFEIKLTDKKILILENYDPDIEVTLDREQITRVLRNLLDNAIKFSKSNSEIRIVSKITSHTWIFSITDQGIGIKKEDIPNIFHRFFKLKDSEHINVKGIGIGLTICKNIIDKYRGKIWVESAGLGHGTTFHFEVPINK